jgi:phospholipid/cholesterol/gamma-HCH transport system substrate-binding protein
VRRLPNWAIGLIAIVLVLFSLYLGFTKKIPFTSEGYQVKAVFQNAQSLRVNSPVRIAGVNVGEVSKIEHLVEDGEGQEAAVVTMNIKDAGRPIREDATMQLRPRLFLEGNLFVDATPGSPGAPELDSGDVIPVSQTSISVQLDQVLTSLQAPVRENLQILLREFGNALDKHGGAEGFRESFRTSPAAFGATAQVNEALLGTEPGDLAGLVVNFDRFVRALDQNEEQLKDLVTNLRTFSGSFAAEDEALEAAIVELPGLLTEGRSALLHLSQSLPPLRGFARDALPGVRGAPETLDRAIPMVRQLRALASKPELRGLVADLRPTVPQLALLARQTIPFFEETRALSSCFSNVIVPWGDDQVEDPNHPATGQVYEETGYGLVGISGESRSGDGNGQTIRVAGGGGPNTVAFEPPGGVLGDAFGTTLLPLLGARPTIESSAKTPFRPDVACETQEPPNLDAAGGPPPAPAPGGALTDSADVEGVVELFDHFQGLLERGDLQEVVELEKRLAGEKVKENSEGEGEGEGDASPEQLDAGGGGGEQ